jgi:hypothetical protein
VGADGRDVRISVFGGLPNDLPRPARQVLGVLAARHDRVQSATALADAVGGPIDEALLQQLGPLVQRRGNGFVLDTRDVELDLAEFRELVRRADAHPPGSHDRLALRAQILALASNPPFPEDEYAEWAVQPRTEARDAVLTATVELAESALADDPLRSLELARAALELDRYLERTYRIAMRASAALGRTDEAMRWFEQCRRTLGDELRMGPSPQTSRLRLELLRAHEAVPVTEAPSVDDSAHFFGRTREIALILNADARVVHLTGPVGAGKSALLAALTRRAPGRVGVGTALGTPETLRLTWLRSVLLQLGVRSTAVDEAMAAQRLLSTEELSAIAEALPEPSLIGVDAAEKLDARSVSELGWLRDNCPQLTVVLAYRAASSIVDRPVAALRAALVVRLAPLSVDELGDPDLYARTGGIPALVADWDAVHLAQQRMRSLPPVAGDILRLLADHGTLGVDEVAERLDDPVEEVLHDLSYAQLIVEDGPGRVKHSSTVIRDIFYEPVPASG